MPGLYMQCECGNTIAKNRWRSGKRDCPQCGIARGIMHNLEMHKKSGVSFDNWRRIMRGKLLESEPDREE